MALANTIRSVVNMIKRLSAPIREIAGSLPSSSSSSASHLDGDLEHLTALLQGVLSALPGAEESEKMQDKLWLRELRCVAYDAQDLLDGFDYDNIQSHSESDAASAAKTVKRARRGEASSFGSSLREIRQRLDVIHRERIAFSLAEGDITRRTAVSLKRLPSGPKVNEMLVFGRETDMTEVVDMLLSDGPNEDNFSVISIVGMGGIGKTTLAQMVFHDDRVIDNFQVRSWVYVSQNFHLPRLTKAVLESMNKPTKHADLSLLQSLLREELAEKRFLLLLDDVWCEESSKWEAFNVPLTTGARGSKLLITTRAENVAKAIGSSMVHSLGFLSQGDCWSLFCQYAFGGQNHAAENTRLVEIGEEIVMKCDGHPFIAKTLGGLLRYETDESRWEMVRDSQILNVSDGNRYILPGMKLSYSLLPSSLKQCLSFCTVIPKSYNLQRGQLIRMWAAQGFLTEQSMEDAGSDYFDYLVQASFLQPRPQHYWDETEEDNDEKMFTMHDVIHDAVKAISMDESLVLEEESNLVPISRDTWHLSVSCSSIGALSFRCESACPPPSRTLILLKDFEDDLDIEVLGNLFSKFQYLRVLDLSFANLNELPASVGTLKHLRYLGLSATNISRLPESVGDLYFLQTLETRHCELVELPKSLGNLINLKHLVHQNYDYATTSLAMMPLGIGKLTCLRTLPIFVVSKEPCSASVAELKDLNELKGDLFIVRLHNATNGAVSTFDANLKEKKHLEMLLLEWGEDAEPRSPSTCKQDEQMLENLEPSTNLRELNLDYGYRGFRFPKWLGNSSFSKLDTIFISGCVNCTYLPPLGQLPALRFLSISEMRRVNHVGLEFLGEGEMRGFPSLLAINFRDMPEWQCWLTQSSQGGDFPFLRVISLENCPKIESISLHNLSALQELTVKNCSQLSSLSCLSVCNMNEAPQCKHVPSSLKCLQFLRCPKLVFSSQEQLPSSVDQFYIHRCHLLEEWGKAHLDKLKHIPQLQVTGEELSIHDVSLEGKAIAEELKLERGLIKLELRWELGVFDYEDKPENVLHCLEPNTNLRELVIHGYRGTIFAAWLGDPSFSKIVKMTLTNCEECTSLPALGRLPSLKELHISTLPEVQSIGQEFSNGGFPSLQILQFENMPQWKVWSLTAENSLPNLRDLTISGCPKLKGLGITLTKIRSNFKLRLEQFDDDLVLRELQNLHACTKMYISKFSNLRVLPDKLPHHLKELEIEGCIRLKALSSLPTQVCRLVLSTCNEKVLRSSCSFPSFPALSYLWIRRFPKLKTLSLSTLPALKELCISNCKALVSICSSTFSSLFPSLTVLSIRDCPVLVFDVEEQLPMSLKYMNVCGSKFMEEWCHNHVMKFSHICKLWIDGILAIPCNNQQEKDFISKEYSS